jgi:hypothetical protein
MRGQVAAPSRTFWSWDAGRVDSDIPTVTIPLWRADALVPFDWLMTTDLDSVPIAAAREEAARDMGW